MRQALRDIVEQENEMPSGDGSNRKLPPVTSDSANFSDGFFLKSSF
jgi:hypothetical protein